MQTLQITIIVFLFSSLQLQSELSKTLQGQAKIDSLLKELPKMKEDTNGVILLKSLSYNYSDINPDFGIKYGKQALELAKKINWDFGKVKSYNSLGINYKAKSNYPKALDNYFKGLKIAEKLKLKSSQAGFLGNIGVIYHHKSDNTKSIEYFQKALKINEELGDTIKVANDLLGLGSVYGFISDYPKSIDYFIKALEIYKEIDNKDGIALCLGNLGNIYSFQSDYPKALEYYFEVLEYYKDSKNKSGEARILGNIGYSYLLMSQDKAINNSENKFQLKLDKEVNLNKSIRYSILALDLFKETGDKFSISNSKKNLSEAYQLKGDYKKAFETYNEYKTLKDSIFSSENNTKIANLEAKRESELKEKEIVILKKDKENEKLQRYAMFGGIAGLGIIIGLILIQRRKSEKLLLNVLPAKIAKRLKAKEHPIADLFDNASIIFIDLVSFTKMSSNANPKEIVALLNDIFTLFDKLADKHGLEKIKTIGDAYMAVAGIPEIQADHSKRAAQMALDIKKEMKDFKTSDGTEIKFRIGIDCGAVVAGVIGEKKFIYDLWSDAVNTASRMESTGESGQIQITENFKTELEKFEGNWNFTFRGEFEIKGKGLMKTYYLGN